MTEGEVRQGREVSDLNADIQIGAGGGIEILDAEAKRNAAGNGIKPTSDLSLRSGESLARYH
jgi:hypothetical protein